MASLRILVGIAAVGSVLAIPAMQPMPSMPALNLNAMTKLENMQIQQQSQGNSAATGGASADFGTISSQQLSNTNTGAQGTQGQAGSVGGCAGGNCALNGAAQLTATGQSQGQNQSASQKMFGQQENGFFGGSPLSENLFGANTLTSQIQHQQQNQINGASVGSGSAALGNISSIQNTVGNTNAAGANVGSSSLGQGIGSQLEMSGAVQATAANQNAVQSVKQGAEKTNQNSAQGRPGCVVHGINSAANNLTLSNQEQSQSQGQGAAVGQGSAAEGTLQSGQTSNIQTDAKGTSVSSGSIGHASGKGLKLSGAVQSSAQSSAQKQSSLNANANQASGVAC